MANEEKKLVEIENLRKYFPIKGTNGPGVQLSLIHISEPTRH